MKANGIHPNGGPSPAPLTHPAPASKTMSKAAIAKAAAAKKRKIEGDSAERFKRDEEDEPVKPKLESVSHQHPYSEGKAESAVGPSVPLPAVNFTTVTEQAPHPQQFDLFDEFCIPEMFTQDNFKDAVVKEEQVAQPLTPSAQQPRHVPPPPAVMVEYFKEPSNLQGRRGSRRGPLDSIIIAD
jgi:hypothetical protein